VLYPARVEFQGKIVDAIRVKLEVPAMEVVEDEEPVADEPPSTDEDDVPF
jgi:hypothetical protein